jgi:hypothetical protein
VAGLQLVLSVLVALLIVWLVVLVAIGRQPGDYLYAAVAMLEVGLVLQLIVGLERLTGDHGHLNVAAYVGYLVGSLLILPAGFFWSLGERTRAGTGVLLVAVIVIPVLFLRLDQLWAAR